MGSANKHQHTPSTKPSKRPNQNTTTSSDNEEPQNPNPNPIPNPNLDFEQDMILSKSEFLTREEVIKRRCRRLKMEIKVYEDYYWSLMEDFRGKHREYYWNYGMSPLEDEEEAAGKKKKGENGVDEIVENGGGVSEHGVDDVKMRMCGFDGCKSKSMALTDYCHSHILNDTNQRLYKACTYVVNSHPETGPVHCGKPILRATVPSLCSEHFGMAQTHVTRALRKAGLNISSSSKLAPKFHVIVAESVRQINMKRRERKSNVSHDLVMEENTNVAVEEKSAV